ncbi:MAG TPA: class I fructose-bisphosphate aldolase [Candidatus Gracilibacteria bacterium]
MSDLHAIAAAMVAPGKGILAIDESHGTCKKRFDALGVEFTEENRRHYRQLLTNAPGIEKGLSGMILFDETLRQSNDQGVPFVKTLESKGILPGIKVDAGSKPLALHPGEEVTEGLDGLRERLKEYAQLGAKFAKWRAVINIGKGLPTDGGIYANCHALARYAGLCQEAGIVPMVEPEIMIDGDHTLARSQEVCEKTWTVLMDLLKFFNVDLKGTILKTSMVIPGKSCPTQASHVEVADATVASFKKVIPAELAGIVFLSGGQNAYDSTMHLNEMNKRHKDCPWPISFSYGRGIQQPALELWAKDPKGNYDEAQKILAHRCAMNGLAASGKYDESHDNL